MKVWCYICANIVLLKEIPYILFILFFYLSFFSYRGTHNSWSQGCEFQPRVACMLLCPWARHFILTCSSPPRCINGYRLRLGRWQACCAEDWQHYKLSSLAQLLAKRRCAPLDALKSVPTQFTLFGGWGGSTVNFYSPPPQYHYKMPQQNLKPTFCKGRSILAPDFL